jgi:DNA-binding transcriptional MerR regulator
MTENNPAVTPPANEPDGGKPPVNDPGKTLTQAEIDAIVEERLARDRKGRAEELAKELGMSIKDAKALIAAKKADDDAKKTELEKLTGERDSLKGELSGAKLEAAKLRALAKVGADPEKIDSLMKRVVGSTPEEIEADVLELKSLGLIGPKEANGAQGAGNTGIPKPKAEPTLQEELEAEQAKGAGADPLKLIQIRSLISEGAKKK